MPRHPPNAQKSTNSTQHTTTNLTSDTGARTALGPAQPTLCRAAHARPPDPHPPDQRGGQEGPKGAANQNNNKKTFLMLASTMQFTTNPPETPRNRATPRPGPHPPNRIEETRTQPRKRPARRGGPEPRAHRPRTRQRATPPQPPAPARRGNGPELKDENKRLRGRVEGAVAGRQGEPPLPARVRPTTLIRVRGPTDSKPLRKEVIQPHLPVRLPCYDFVPITGPAFDRSPWGHGLRASPTFMT